MKSKKVEQTRNMMNSIKNKINENWTSDYNDYISHRDEYKEYRYIVDLDERGEYNAHIEDENDNVVYEIDTEEIIQLIQDGFMKNNQDMSGLLNHLIDVEILPKRADLTYEG